MSPIPGYESSVPGFAGLPSASKPYSTLLENAAIGFSTMTITRATVPGKLLSMVVSS